MISDANACFEEEIEADTWEELESMRVADFGVAAEDAKEVACEGLYCAEGRPRDEPPSEHPELLKSAHC